MHHLDAATHRLSKKDTQAQHTVPQRMPKPHEKKETAYRSAWAARAKAKFLSFIETEIIRPICPFSPHFLFSLNISNDSNVHIGARLEFFTISDFSKKQTVVESAT